MQEQPYDLFLAGKILSGENMNTNADCIEVRNYLQQSYCSAIAQDAIRGFTASQKCIPSKYFYDARGSQLFEEICNLPEYYPTRTEISILKHAAPKIMGSFPGGDIVELGSGANRKIRIFLDSAGEEKLLHFRYVPVDVSESALREASEELQRLYANIEVVGIVADFILHMDRIPCDNPRLIIFLGSTIGNFNETMQGDFLRSVARSMNPDDRFVIGFDMIKPKETLEAAYNDSRGVTSKFNKNVLHVLNRELNADFQPSQFEHVAFFNDEKERVEMHLRANKETVVTLYDLDLEIRIEKDETIHTENSCKFSRSRVENMVSDADLTIRDWYFDPKGWFSLAELSV
jgi:L-histidine N-alpha-methyltransferase